MVALEVSRIETARIGIAADDLDRLLELHRVPDEQADLLRRLAPSARPRGWWDAYADTLSADYADLVRLESGSRALRCFGALVPHGLLQTPDYVRQERLAAAGSCQAGSAPRCCARLPRRPRAREEAQDRPVPGPP